VIAARRVQVTLLHMLWTVTLLLRTSTEEFTLNIGGRADIVPALFFDRQVSGVLERGSAR
jgi:hypothetical protein